MSRISESIEIDLPVHTVYNQWTQFEDFPQFMEGVESVKQLDDTRLHWVAEIGGHRREWDAKIVDQTPDHHIAWEGSLEDPSGAVTFEPIADNRALLTLEFDFEPQGMKEKVGDTLGVADRRVRGDLERFKHFVESRGTETGAWRGDISGGQAQAS
jgi:uncharacterized membrane protein